jgi:hypothetical protein
MIEHFSTARTSLAARLITVFVTELMLFTPVIVFSLVSMSRAWTAIVVLILTFSFPIIVSLLTNAGIQEIFLGTATYGAVLVIVIFLNGTIPWLKRYD